MTDIITSQESFKTRLDKTWESIYLTLISIVQGVVFSYFLYQLVIYSKDFALYNWLFSLITFIVIVLVWHEYVTGTVAFRWSPGILDSVIPFLMGVFQIYAIEYIYIPEEKGEWFFSMYLFLMMGAIAYINMYYKASKSNRNDKVFKALGKGLIRMSYAAPLFLSFLFYIFSFRILRYDYSNPIISNLAIFSAIIFILYVIFVSYLRQTLLKEGKLYLFIIAFRRCF